MRTFSDVAELTTAVGVHLGYSDWQAVTQEQVDLFARATGDHQWIHTDPRRATRGPFGGTIAHGFLTASLVPQMLWQIYQVQGIAMTLNYGADRVRFPAVVPVGSRLRAGAQLVSVEPHVLGHRVVTRVIVDVAGGPKPACAMEAISVLVAE